MTLLFLNLGGGEVVVILLVILLFFGSKSIPSLAKGLGRGIREFKEAADGIKREIEESAKPMADQMHIDLDESRASVQQPKQAENQPISPAEKSVDEIIAETKSRDTAEKKVGE